MLYHVVSRIHFNQSPETVLNYLSTTDYWPEWHIQSRRVEGTVGRPMQLGDKVIEYVSLNPDDKENLRVVEWTVVDRWLSRMYRIEARAVVNGSVTDEVVSAISYVLFPTGDGGTDFTREMNIVRPKDMRHFDEFKKLQDKSVENIKTALDKRFC
ncbi:MAG: SRPBCC family protein [Dehalococcoidia bacterium]|nr:SRPBCC family protein [Dehalococcoidia bacterium]